MLVTPITQRTSWGAHRTRQPHKEAHHEQPTRKPTSVRSGGLTNVTLPYVRQIASLGLTGAIEKNPLLKHGVNTYGGCVTYEAVASSQQQPCANLEDLL